MDLLTESEYVNARKLQDGNTSMYIGLNLTDKGYDLLTHISNKTVWDIIKWLSQNKMPAIFPQIHAFCCGILQT